MSAGERSGKAGLTAALDPKSAIAHASAVLDRADAEDAALLASGEELLTLKQIARKLHVPFRDLEKIVVPAGLRYLTSATPYRFIVRDVVEVVRPHLERLGGALPDVGGAGTSGVATTGAK
jgi:hypothetical protein